ncbi:MAG TPA: insulinase family protein [Holophagaceae bacterium]|nr:insulinase family protein [Holophagaceae bacterium]
MRRLPLALIPAVLAAGPAQAPKKPSAFPFPVHSRTLANGLKVVVIPTGMPGLVSLQIPVSTGSRNEVEPGKSGFAHFFEHMMFRGTPTVKPEQWIKTLQATGASQNAYTSDDLTNYHTLFAKEDLETWIRLEADRFQHLSYDEGAFKTEARAVLGEYNKNSANPGQKLYEVMRDAAFQTHTYKHTTMGFLKDIEDMPNQYAYSMSFFQRWYKPGNVTVIVAGDVEPAATFALVEKHFGGWAKGTAKPPVIPVEPEPKAPVTAHVPWDSPTIPLVSLAFHTPAKFSSTSKDALALDFVANLLFGPRSELYQRLVVREQKVDQLSAGGGDNKDPELFSIVARVKKAEDMAAVREAILDACAQARALPFSAARLEGSKNEERVALARRLDSTHAVAGYVARQLCYDRDPGVLEKVPALREAVTPQDLSAIARATFTDAHRVETTLCFGALPAGYATAYEGVEARAAKLAQVPQLPLLEQRLATSPLVNLRVSFRVGSLHDPAGKEGLAQLTASMITEAATRQRSFQELTKAYGATGSRLGALVDKERTSFTLNVPNAKAAEALELALEQLVETGFTESDFRRLKSQQTNALNVGLKANNDEELGKLALEARMYAEPYAHPVLGTGRGLEAITLEDVKTFARTYYSRKRISVGLGGSYDDAFKATVLRGLGRLSEVAAPPVAFSEAEHLPVSHLQIVTKETRATAISFGIPLRERDEKGTPIDARVNRAHPDFPALWVATSYLGQHRNSTGVLYQHLREARGLNYGDYAYLEAFPGGMFRFQPDPGVARAFNHWQVWIRPVAPVNGPFALKAALFEVDRLVKEGMPTEGFEATRTFLVKFLDHLSDTGGKRLGHAMDNASFGLPEYGPAFKAKLKALTKADVDKVIRKYLRTTALDVVVITKDAEAFKAGFFAEASVIPKYDAPKPELKAEDEAIARFKTDLKPEAVTVTPLEELFK